MNKKANHLFNLIPANGTQSTVVDVGHKHRQFVKFKTIGNDSFLYHTHKAHNSNNNRGKWMVRKWFWSCCVNDLIAFAYWDAIDLLFLILNVWTFFGRVALMEDRLSTHNTVKFSCISNIFHLKFMKFLMKVISINS